MVDTKSKTPSLTVDAIIEHAGSVILIRRGNDPFKDNLALPGGFVDYNEPVEQALIREVKEEVGLDVKVHEILGVYSKPDRDPRGHVVSIVMICDLTSAVNPVAGDDAASFEWIPTTEIHQIELAFDHQQILDHYLTWKNLKGTYWSSKN